MIIDCDECTAPRSRCADCVVGHLLARPPRMDLDQDARRALTVLADSGLVPPLRMQPCKQVPGSPSGRASRAG